MSFELFLSCYDRNEPSCFQRSILNDAFGPNLKVIDDRFCQIQYSANEWADIYLNEGPDISGFMISRPPKALPFWNGLMTILTLTPSVLFWPGEAGICAVTQRDLTKHLPEDFVRDCGAPVIVGDGHSLLNLVMTA